ncbi:MAG: hypothetical protein M1505_01245 [Patescibacteria group bacterium]|nr:hypothetical protein [Patescibacteria group bacterium]MCL5257840.1 hypothetical protein [Patescibacteria group bacterium]
MEAMDTDDNDARVSKQIIEQINQSWKDSFITEKEYSSPGKTNPTPQWKLMEIRITIRLNSVLDRMRTQMEKINSIEKRIENLEEKVWISILLSVSGILLLLWVCYISPK